MTSRVVTERWALSAAQRRPPHSGQVRVSAGSSRVWLGWGRAVRRAMVKLLEVKPTQGVTDLVIPNQGNFANLEKKAPGSGRVETLLKNFANLRWTIYELISSSKCRSFAS